MFFRIHWVSRFRVLSPQPGTDHLAFFFLHSPNPFRKLPIEGFSTQLSRISQNCNKIVFFSAPFPRYADRVKELKEGQGSPADVRPQATQGRARNVAWVRNVLYMTPTARDPHFQPGWTRPSFWTIFKNLPLSS